MEYKYQSFFEKIIEEHGRPEYIIGVTFGVDLDKWRSINKTVFGKEFSERIPFHKAFLFTDKVYIKDTSPNRDLYQGNLFYAIPNVTSYLHTKFILLCYKEKYVLVLSTKNINGNSSYDCILPLVFTKVNGIEKTHGKQVKEYLEYLKGKCRTYDVPKQFNTCISSLGEYHITSTLEGFKVDSFEFAYGEKRFSDMLWGKVIGSQEIVSPYLDEKMIGCISKGTKVLAYPDQISKVKDGKSDIDFRVGKGIYEENMVIAQRKYHAKLYFHWDSEKMSGRMIVGSANLTAKAKESHCEILVELCTENVEIYNSRKSFFEDLECTELYNAATDYTLLVDDEDDTDDENPITSIRNNERIYVKKNATTNLFELHIVNEKNQDIVWGAPYTIATFYVLYGGHMILVDENRYVPDEEIEKYPYALTFKEYSDFVSENRLKLQKDSDKFVLTGKKREGSANQGTKREKEGNGVVVEDIPCLFDTLFRRLEQKRQKNKESTITEQQIVEELQIIRNSLYDEKLIAQIDLLLKSVVTKDE